MIILLPLLFSSFDVIHIKTITFTSGDGLQITADEYFISSDKPYVILFHEQGSSRGEFHTIAKRLCKMDYNCLAVDIRNGGNNNTISNETAKRCRVNKCRSGAADVELDIKASIEYAFGRSNLPVILFGSGANGSLVLKVAQEQDNVRAVIALSPGEYFLPEINIQHIASKLKKPVFISSGSFEFPYVSQLASEIDKEYLDLFKPVTENVGRGSSLLTAENENNSEYWLALLLFFKDLV